MKILLFIVTLFISLHQEFKKVYILMDKDDTSIIYNEDLKKVNLYIDHTLIPDEKLQMGIKLYIASFYVNNRNNLSADFIKIFQCSISDFGRMNRKPISKVIYYLEHENHGNLPFVYQNDAYLLLEINELKPNITSIREKLEKSGMLLIEGDGNLQQKKLKWLKK
ncbi:MULTISPECIES: hypothetical protein [unclassified Sphingobacterium]|uniref:hypothetical protein n=1 Tax=unclassified Sphingobacterium TaxID=2609468 RepID=UPI0014396C02|nr:MULTISPECIES: hypothetical protein [unclassified Sphingobacterium]MBB2950911.1 hypothetical protein [Sphingobacterium sp. JUb56]NJI72577.1 hypothetical protein [Sphingobacterium sp. B16(2022)]